MGDGSGRCPRCRNRPAGPRPEQLRLQLEDEVPKSEPLSAWHGCREHSADFRVVGLRLQWLESVSIICLFPLSCDGSWRAKLLKAALPSNLQAMASLGMASLIRCYKWPPNAETRQKLFVSFSRQSHSSTFTSTSSTVYVSSVSSFSNPSHPVSNERTDEIKTSSPHFKHLVLLRLVLLVIWSLHVPRH